MKCGDCKQFKLIITIIPDTIGLCEEEFSPCYQQVIGEYHKECNCFEEK